MKAITVCQSYASMIALEMKPVENREWYTPHRGPLLIHAGPWCWILANVERFATPIAYTGQRKLFEVPDALLPARAVAA